MQVPSAADESVTSKCIHCGAAISKTAKFCPDCGATQSPQSVENATNSVPSEEPSINPEATALTSDNKSLHQSPRSHRKAVVIMSCSVLFLLVCSAFGLIALNSHRTQVAAREIGIKQDAIRKHEKFAVCRIRKLQIIGYSGPCSISNGLCQGLASQEDFDGVQLLSNAGYLTEHIDTSRYGNGVPIALNSKGKGAIGSTIQEKKVSGGGRLVEVNEWTLVLGCRELSGIDATTPLADGEKVDFSWQWKPTDLGIADGLTDARQRGVAYLTRSSNGFTVDRIQIDSDTRSKSSPTDSRVNSIDTGSIPACPAGSQPTQSSWNGNIHHQCKLPTKDEYGDDMCIEWQTEHWEPGTSVPCSARFSSITGIAKNGEGIQ